MRWKNRIGRVLSVAAAAMIVGSVTVSTAAAQRVQGQHVRLGNGQASTYTEFEADGTPRAIGLAFSAGALEGLPSELSDRHHCFDRNGDGMVMRPGECSDTHEWIIPLPDAVSTRSDIPFSWVLLNWNPVGHIPPGVYDAPHFDVHFYMAPIADVFAIAGGPCGPEFVNCEDFETARMPVPPNFMHPDFTNVDAVVPAMGNHLIALGAPEFNGQPFTNTWIYGTYGGRVTFYEGMMTLDYLRSRPDGCTPIKTPAAYEVAGFYPTQYCVRHQAATDDYTVSMEGFVRREASAAQPVAPNPGPAQASPQ